MQNFRSVDFSAQKSAFLLTCILRYIIFFNANFTLSLKKNKQVTNKSNNYAGRKDVGICKIFKISLFQVFLKITGITKNACILWYIHL